MHYTLEDITLKPIAGGTWSVWVNKGLTFQGIVRADQDGYTAMSDLTEVISQGHDALTMAAKAVCNYKAQKTQQVQQKRLEAMLSSLKAA